MNNITITNSKGEKKEYEVLFDYITSNDNKKYVIYTDFNKDKENTIECFSSIIDDNGNLSEIKDQEQIDFIESTLKSLADLSNLKYKIKTHN